MIGSMAGEQAEAAKLPQEGQAGGAKAQASNQTRGYLIALVQEADRIRAFGKCWQPTNEAAVLLAATFAQNLALLQPCKVTKPNYISLGGGS